MNMSQKTFNITKNTLLKACSGTVLTAAMLCGTIGSVNAQVLVKNDGAIFAIKSGATVIVKTGSVENDGLVDNGGTFIIEGDFINQDTANGGGTVGNYQVQQDWVNNGSFQADQSEVELYGANQLITGTNSTTFYDLTLTGTGVKTQTLNATVTDILVLNGRELATDAFKMFVTNTATGAITRTSGYVSSLGAGRLSRDMASNGLYLFPTGSNVGVTRYRPLEVTPSSTNAQTLEVRMANVNATTEGFNIATKEVDLCEVNDLYYHLIGHSAGSTDNVALALYYDLAADGIFKTAAHWQNLPQWEDIGPTTAGVSGGLSSVTVPAWNVFSPEAFALANSNPTIDTNGTVTDASCFGLSDGAIDFTVLVGTDLTYTYTPAVGPGPGATNLPAGTYTLVITDTVTGCNRSAVPYSFVVDQPLEIQIDSAVTAANCNGLATGAIDLTVTNAGGGVGSINWTGTNQTGASVTGLAAGTYTATVLDNDGCQKTTTIEVTEPDALVVDPTITSATCNSLETGSIVLDVTGGTGGYNFAWSSSASDTLATLSGVGAGSYGVVVTDANGCADSLSGLVVTEPDLLTLIASNDTTIPASYTATVEVLSTTGGTGSVTYEWTPGITLSDATAASTTASPLETTTYLVTGTDDNGCKAQDTVVVRVDFDLVAIPDGFTPNGDGINDVFTIHHSTAIELVELKIFNRWGQLIYEANDWNGTYKDKEQPMDTYVYQAVFKLPDGTSSSYSGDFLLIR
jgi:gliding motility-associated-like protein